MGSQPVKQTITIHKLPGISRCEGNQTMKSDQLIEHDSNIFLEKSCTKRGGETSPTPFFKKPNFSISLDQ